MKRPNPPFGAVCIEPDCTRAATTLRSGGDGWITDQGVLFDYDEWVCATHARRD